MDKYEIVETIGTGSFGVVNKAIDKATKNIVALKGINKGNYGPKELKNFHKECRIHAQLRHPNIICMLESFETPDYIFVVTDFAAIDLHKFMKNRPIPKLAEDHVQLLTGDLISALDYLHKRRIVHRDLKPQNILLNENGMDAKLCDFGLARNMSRETHLLTSVKGTPLYMAPEVMRDEPYDHQAEFWSLGCILYEMLIGQPPFKAKSMNHLQNLLQKQPIVWPNAGESCLSFLQGLLKKNKDERFTWSAIQNHPFVKDHLNTMENEAVDSPLTNELSDSLALKKKKQREQIILKKEKKFIAERAKWCKTNAETHHIQAAALLTQQQQQANATDENTSISSLDSVNAIRQTDVETDVENAPIVMALKSASNAIPENSNLIIQRFPDNFADANEAKPTTPASQNAEQRLNNSNLVIGKMADNLKNDEVDERMKQLNLKPQDATAAPRPNVNHNVNQILTHGKNKDLEKRKLSLNLDNFSIRLGAGSLPPTSESTEETIKCQKEKEKTIPMVETNVSVSDLPIENEEWLAFIRTSMQEVLEGQIETLKQQNLVGIIVAILRNLNASSKVIETVVQLLIMPFVLSMSVADMTEIENTYVQTKILPNLIFASKLICKLKPINQSHSSNASSNSDSLSRTLATTPAKKPVYVYVKMNELSSDQLSTLLRIYELTCHLVHLNEQFLTQFCESIMIIASDLFVHILSDVTRHPEVIQLTSIIVAMLCYTLREVPENAEHIEKIIFHENVNLIPLLKCENSMLKTRMCMLLRIVGRFSCFALQNAWTMELKEALEALTTDNDDTVQERAKSTIEEFSYFSFYNAQRTN